MTKLCPCVHVTLFFLFLERPEREDMSNTWSLLFLYLSARNHFFSLTQLLCPVAVWFFSCHLCFFVWVCVWVLIRLTFLIILSLESIPLYNWIDSIFLLVSLYFLFHFGLYLSMPYWAPSECVCVCAASCSPVGISTLLELRVVPVATFLFLSLYQVFTQCRIRRNIELLSLPSRSLSFPYIMTTQCIGVNVPFDSGLFVQFFSDLGIFAILIMWGRRGWASQFLLGVCAFFLLQ